MSMCSIYTDLHTCVCVYVYAYIHRYMCVAECFSNYFAGPINPLEIQFMDIRFLKCVTVVHFYLRL